MSIQIILPLVVTYRQIVVRLSNLFDPDVSRSFRYDGRLHVAESDRLVEVLFDCRASCAVTVTHPALVLDRV